MSHIMVMPFIDWETSSYSCHPLGALQGLSLPSLGNSRMGVCRRKASRILEVSEGGKRLNFLLLAPFLAKSKVQTGSRLSSGCCVASGGLVSISGPLIPYLCFVLGSNITRSESIRSSRQENAPNLKQKLVLFL